MINQDFERVLHELERLLRERDEARTEVERMDNACAAMSSKITKLEAEVKRLQSTPPDEFDLAVAKRLKNYLDNSISDFLIFAGKDLLDAIRRNLDQSRSTDIISACARLKSAWLKIKEQEKNNEYV